MAKKAKKLTKTGRPRTGTRPGSGKRRGEVRAGARAGNRERARTKRTVKRKTDVTRGAVKSRRTRRKVANNVRSRASSAATAGRSRGGDLAAPGPSIPLRDLVRGGLPRSRKAHRPGTVTTSPWASRRNKSASGLPLRGKIMQNQPDRLEHVGSLRMAIPKR